MLNAARALSGFEPKPDGEQPRDSSTCRVVFLLLLLLLPASLRVLQSREHWWKLSHVASKCRAKDLRKQVDFTSNVTSLLHRLHLEAGQANGFMLKSASSKEYPAMSSTSARTMVPEGTKLAHRGVNT